MNLRQQIVQDRIEQTAKILKVDEDTAFLRFSHSLITGQSIHSFDDKELVDGGQDKQIDVLSIEQEEETATIYIIQTKNTDGFSSNSFIQMSNGLDWIFNKSRADVSNLANMPFKDKIFEYRSIQSDLGPSNLNIVVAFVTNGVTSLISDEFEQEHKTVVDRYDNNTFASFELVIWGADELVARINNLEKKNRKIDENIKIKYDANNPSLIKYHVNDFKGLICTTTAEEIARIVNSDSTGSVFDNNIRQFLGSKGAVNSDIYHTCSEKDSSYQFWFLNNGITIVCDSFDAITDPDSPHIKVKNLQIVNGCQTSTTMAVVAQKGMLQPDTRVLLRIYEAPESDLVGKIVLTTNNQNKITSRDLKANDPIQHDMETGFQRYGYFYERKPRQYDIQPNLDSTKIVPNELVAQCYLSVVLKKPSDARRRKYKVWGDYYGQIFSGHIIEPYVLSFIIYKQTYLWLRKSSYANSRDVTERKTANNGVFHIARMAGHLWRKNDFAKLDKDALEKETRGLIKKPSLLDRSIEDAFKVLVELIKEDNAHISDIDAALKSGRLDSDMDKAVYSGRKPSKKPVS